MHLSSSTDPDADRSRRDPSLSDLTGDRRRVVPEVLDNAVAGARPAPPRAHQCSARRRLWRTVAVGPALSNEQLPALYSIGKAFARSPRKGKESFCAESEKTRRKPEVAGLVPIGVQGSSVQRIGASCICRATDQSSLGASRICHATDQTSLGASGVRRATEQGRLGSSGLRRATNHGSLGAPGLRRATDDVSFAPSGLRRATDNGSFGTSGLCRVTDNVSLGTSGLCATASNSSRVGAAGLCSAAYKTSRLGAEELCLATTGLCHRTADHRCLATNGIRGGTANHSRRISAAAGCHVTYRCLSPTIRRVSRLCHATSGNTATGSGIAYRLRRRASPGDDAGSRGVPTHGNPTGGASTGHLLPSGNGSDATPRWPDHGACHGSRSSTRVTVPGSERCADAVAHRGPGPVSYTVAGACAFDGAVELGVGEPVAVAGARARAGGRVGGAERARRCRSGSGVLGGRWDGRRVLSRAWLYRCLRTVRPHDLGTTRDKKASVMKSSPEMLKVYKRVRRRTVHVVPDEIVVEILVRLPVKALTRFKSVSKAWYAIISDPFFIRLHLQQQSAKNQEQTPSFLVIPHTLYKANDGEIWPTTFSGDISFYSWKEGQDSATLVHTSNFQSEFESVFPMLHCDGLFVLPTNTKVYVFNPATHDVLKLRNDQKDEWFYPTVGLGLHLLTSK
nr:unnamed protein product [Digitaria exilis]